MIVSLGWHKTISPMNLRVSHFIPILVVLSRTLCAQIAPAGSVYVQQPSGVHYIFGTGGTATGGGFFYVDYLTGQYDVITTTVSSTGTISGSSSLTGRFITGQVNSTSITLVYNGTTVTGDKLSAYGVASAFDGGYSGVITEPTLGIFAAQLAVSSNGVVLLFTAGNAGVNIGVGSIDASGHLSVTDLVGETISTTVVLKNGITQGTAQSSFGYTYSYTATRTVPPRLANISTRGFVGSGEQVLIGGFIIKDGGKTVLINAKGPSLTSKGVLSAIPNPRLDLYFNGTVIASNDDWATNANASQIATSGVGPTDNREASLQVALEPGAYTAIVSSADGSQGIGLVEVYGIE